MDKAHPAPGAGPLGLAVFLASLAVLFGASLVGYWAVRSTNAQWADGMPDMPASLWLSTLLLIASSVTMHGAWSKARKGAEPDAVGRSMAITTLLGFGFLAAQLWVWWSLVAVDVTADRNLYGFTFYMLTALHAVHVIAGLIPMVVTTKRAYAGRYGTEQHDGVTMCAMYWHFLDAVWLIIFCNLVFVG